MPFSLVWIVGIEVERLQHPFEVKPVRQEVQVDFVDQCHHFANAVVDVTVKQGRGQGKFATSIDTLELHLALVTPAMVRKTVILPRFQPTFEVAVHRRIGRYIGQHTGDSQPLPGAVEDPLEAMVPVPPGDERCVPAPLLPPAKGLEHTPTGVGFQNIADLYRGARCRDSGQCATAPTPGSAFREIPGG